MELLVDNTTISVPEQWIRRWQFLSDYHDFTTRDLPINTEEPQSNVLEWKYTPLAEVEQWVLLNQNMDKYREGYEDYGDKLYLVGGELPPSIPLSSLYKTVDFMLPYTDEFLFYTHIDKKLSPSVRSKLYDRLGRATEEWGVAHGGNQEAVYEVFNLEGAFSPISSESRELSIVGEHPIIVEAMNKINSLPFLRILGILRNSYQEKRSEPGDAIVSVDWSEMRDLVFNAENAKLYNKVVSELPSPFSLYETDGHAGDDMTELMRVLTLLPDFSTRPVSLLLLSKIPLIEESNPTSDVIGRTVQCLRETEITTYYDHRHILDRVEYEHTSAVRYFIECIDFQVDNADVKQLPWIAKMILGLSPFFSHTRYGRSIYSNKNIPFYTLLLTEVASAFQDGGHTIPDRKEYPRMCKVLAATMGTYYLSVCVKCLTRILDANLQPRRINLMRGTHSVNLLVDYKNERTRMESFIQAAQPYIHKKTLYRCFPSDYIPRK